ncbi:MAG: ATP synthase F1 subunit epsilon [Candidatus Paceibacterota bacterium]|jgi:F-type H+-transporting ATPase subunit epsilon
MAFVSFEVVTPEGLTWQEEVYSVVLPTAEGEIGVLANHEPLVTIIKPGVIYIKRAATDSADRLEHIATTGGFAEIDGKRVRVLADVAERADDIDEMKAKEALERAQEMRRTQKDEVALADAMGLIELNLARLKVAELRRRRAR